jgi:hypothetical protein
MKSRPRFRAAFHWNLYLQKFTFTPAVLVCSNTTAPSQLRSDSRTAMAQFLQTLLPTIKLTMISGVTPDLPINEPLSTSAADTTGVMRFSTIQYIYNLATKPLPDSSATYQIEITVPFTGQKVTANFGLRP